MSAVITGDQTSTTGLINSKTAVASTSGTAIDFTGIPAGVRRITVMFNGVSTNGSSAPLLQVGSGSVTTSGYLGSSAGFGSTISSANVTTGFGLGGVSGTTWGASVVSSGSVVLTNVTGNTFVCSGVFGRSDTGGGYLVGGNVTLSGTLDRVRVTTSNGTDTFDAGSINILYE